MSSISFPLFKFYILLLPPCPSSSSSSNKDLTVRWLNEHQELCGVIEVSVRLSILFCDIDVDSILEFKSPIHAYICIYTCVLHKLITDISSGWTLTVTNMCVVIYRDPKKRGNDLIWRRKKSDTKMVCFEWDLQFHFILLKQDWKQINQQQ